MSGYGFVPLPDEVHRRPRENDCHNKRLPGYWQALFTMKFFVDEPIHIGTGSRGLDEGKVVREGARVEGGPGVPGSSLKGVLRARLEAISKSCVADELRAKKLTGAIPSRSFPDYTVEFAPDVQRRFRDLSRTCADDRTCLACSLFGRMGHRGRVSVHDFKATNTVDFEQRQMPQLFSPRPHHLGDFDDWRGEKRLIVTMLHGRKFHRNGGPGSPGKRELVEAIPARAKLEGSLSVINASEAELGALLSALGSTPKSFLKIGSGKAHGFGRTTLLDLQIKLRSLQGTQLAEEADQKNWRSSFENGPDWWPIGEEQLHAIHRIAPGTQP